MITGGLETFRNMVPGAIKAVEGGHPIQVGILSREQDGPAGSADGIGHEGFCKADSILRQTINIRSLIDLGTIGGDGVLGVVVREDEKDVRRDGEAAGAKGKSSQQGGEKKGESFHGG